MPRRGKWDATNRARARRPEGLGLNKTEQAYARVLHLRKLAGEILRYEFEAVRLTLGARLTYTPDFYVLEHDMVPTFHEVKGSAAFKLDPTGRVKIKLAAERFPEFRFIAVVQRTKKAGGGWTYEEIKTQAGARLEWENTT